MTDTVEQTEQTDTNATQSSEDQQPQESAQEGGGKKVMMTQMTDVELFQHGLDMLRSASESSPQVAEYYRYLQIRNFGKDVSAEEANAATLEDERQQAVVAEFLRDKLVGIKTDAISLDAKSINHAFDNIFGLVQINLDAENLNEDYYDNVFKYRAALIPDLLTDYQILKLNREMLGLYHSKNDTAELNSKIMKMEDYYANDDITREQMAQFYYNVGMIYEVNSVQKNTSQAVYREHYMALSYKCKALDITKTNIELILNVQRDWQDSYDYNPQKILDACHRVIDNSDDQRDIYRAHKLYADTLVDFKGTDGFSNKRNERVKSIIKHYQSALEYTQNKEEKIDVLKAISEQQKTADPDAYIQTRMELVELLSGRSRIREYVKISDISNNDALKVTLLKAGINEFHELKEITDEDRRLYDELDKKLRMVLPDDKQSEYVLRKLDTLKKKYGLNEKKKTNKKLFSASSSRGFDYFVPKGKGITD